MMGKAVTSTSQYVRKTDSGILCLTDEETRSEEEIIDGIKSKSATMQVIGQDTFYTAEPIDLSRFDIHTHNGGRASRQDNTNAALFKTSQPEQRKTIHTHTIYYSIDDSELSADDKKGLRAVIELLIDNPSIGAEINGYADTRGEQSHNLNLSQKRAQNVLKYLLDNNVDGRKIITQGHGESTEHGIYDSKTKDMNYRRVEINLFELKN